MRLVRRIFTILLGIALLCVLAPASGAQETFNRTTVLFTHDLHSNFFPHAVESGGESAGYARLKTALDAQRGKYPDALVLDGGDFSVGSLIQTLYTSQAPELRTMGALGYDATTAGNHEFDHSGMGFARMLQAAVRSGDKVPALLMSNYRPDNDNPQQLDILRAMAGYGVQDYILLERGGVTYGIFGLMGQDADNSAPASGFVLNDMVQNAQRCVDALKQQGAQFIIALSHSGTNQIEKLSEDEQLAKKVDGIDLIVSGHTHTTLEQPIVVGDTFIVSSGPNCENLGSITLSWSERGDKELVNYELIAIDERLAEDQEVVALTNQWKEQVSSGYLSRYGLSYDQVLAHTDIALNTPRSGVQEPNVLGDMVAEAYYRAVLLAQGEDAERVDVAVVADGVLRADLPAGDITVSQVFDVLPLGVGADGTSGYPLVSCYLTGKEIRAMLEVDASVTPIMHSAQLYIHGVDYSFNTNRMLFNRVTQATLSTGPIENDRLYRVVSGLYSAQMLGAVNERSFGLLTITPKDAQGNPITDFSKHIIYDQNGNEVKEWLALADYLASFDDQALSMRIASDSGKQVSHSWSPIQLLENLNWIGVLALLILVILVAVAVLIVRAVLRGRKRRRYGGSRRRRRLF